MPRNPLEIQKSLKVLYLARYGRLGASSRIRGYQYLPYLRDAGLDVTISPLLQDAYLKTLYTGAQPAWSDVFAAYARRVLALGRRRHFDVIWVEYEAFPWLPAALETAALAGSTPYLVDYDDAIFHRYDQHSNRWVRRWLGGKIDTIMKGAATVVCGNEYLAARAHLVGSRRVEILPTVVDLLRYPRCAQPRWIRAGDVPVIGWIGSPATAHYLQQVRGPLAAVCQGGKARVRLVGARDPQWTDIPYEVLPWSEDTEVAMLKEIDIGIMPLPDSPWEQGKCGYKLIQYMACGLPVVASPVGVNRHIVTHGVNGFVADTSEQWEAALILLSRDGYFRRRMGAAGRALVESNYCVQVTAPRLVNIIFKAAEAKVCAS
jgi:glycosyltransferase involved in cell wall biosynthesis